MATFGFGPCAWSEDRWSSDMAGRLTGVPSGKQPRTKGDKNRNSATTDKVVCMMLVGFGED